MKDKNYWTEGTWVLDLLEKERNEYVFVPHAATAGSDLVTVVKGTVVTNSTNTDREMDMNHMDYYDGGYNSSSYSSPFTGRILLITEKEFTSIEETAEEMRKLGRADVELHGRDMGDNFKEMGYLLAFAKAVRDQSHFTAKGKLRDMSPEIRAALPLRVRGFYETEGRVATTGKVRV